MIRIILLGTLAVVVAGCVSVPKELNSSRSFADVVPQQVVSDEHNGQYVRWGGVIIKVEPQDNKTCFQTLGVPLDRSAEPKPDAHSVGRFIACANGFYDPAAYPEGRAVTFTGTISGVEEKKVGEYSYGFPVLNADSVYLWPKRPDVVYVPYQDPFWDPFWPYYYYPYRHHHFR